jgi:hypothetical protein
MSLPIPIHLRAFAASTLLLIAVTAASSARKRPAVWRPVAKLPFPNHDVAGTVLDGRAYVAGGMAFVGEKDEHRYYPDLLAYDWKADRWRTLAPMGRPRALAGMAALDGKLWVAGGRTGDAPETFTDTAEVYSPESDAWKDLPPMSTPRTEPGVAGMDGRLYVMGGADRKDQPLASVESYDPRSGAWRAEPPMPSPRRGLVAVTGRDRIWVLGGARECASYDPKKRRWSRHAPPAAVRYSPGVAFYRDRLWAMGGNSVGDQLSTTEIYDPKTDRWSEGPPLPNRMGWFAALPLHDRLLIAGGLYFDQGRKKYVFLDAAYVLEDGR